MGVDLGVLDTKVAATKGARCILVHPDTREPLKDEEGNVPFLLLGGKDSEQYQAEVRRWQARRLEAAARARRIKAPSGEALQGELEEHALNLLAAVTFGWGYAAPGGEVVEPVLRLNGEVLAFSPAAARRLYAEGPPFVREQAEEFVDERGHFLPPSKTN